MSNLYNRNQSQGVPFSARKVIGMEKTVYGPNSVSDVEQASSADAPVEESIKEADKTVTRAEKREQFSALEKSRRLEASAKEKLAKAQELSDAYASKDLERIAKANDMSTTDYIRWVNAKAIGAPTERTLTPAEQVQQSAQDWKDRMDADMKAVQQDAANNRKDSYINKNIIPHLIKDPDKFEFIHDRGIDETASIIYDFMNQHYVETGGKNGGEELDPVELLNSLEEEYMGQWKANQEKAKKFKKLQAIAEGKEADPNNPNAKRVGPGKMVEHPQSETDNFATMLAGEVDEDALAQSAPSNLTGGASRGSTQGSAGTPGAPIRNAVETGGRTPKNSKFSRESRLAAMAKQHQGQ